MNFYAIGPLAAAELLNDHPYHMALAQYLYDKDYINYMHFHLTKGHKVILDSGVYEDHSVDDRQLLYWCKKLQPTAVILPDKPHDCRETLKRSLKFAQMLDDSKNVFFGPVQKWKVLHADKLDDFIQAYIYDSRLFDRVCFSRLTETYGSSYVSRPQFIQYLRNNDFWNPAAYHHALGMKDGSLEELGQLAQLGINSCDSSAPIWRGLNGCTMPRLPTPFPISFDPFSALTITDQAISNFKEVNTQCLVSK